MIRRTHPFRSFSPEIGQKPLVPDFSPTIHPRPPPLPSCCWGLPRLFPEACSKIFYKKEKLGVLHPPRNLSEPGRPWRETFWFDEWKRGGERRKTCVLFLFFSYPFQIPVGWFVNEDPGAQNSPSGFFWGEIKENTNWHGMIRLSPPKSRQGRWDFRNVFSEGEARTKRNTGRFWESDG